MKNSSGPGFIGHLIPVLVSAFAVAWFGCTSAADEAARGAQLAATCASCHGPGDADSGIPAIAGRDAQEIIDAMHAYKADEGSSHVMHAVAISLSEVEVVSVARALATMGIEQP